MGSQSQNRYPRETDTECAHLIRKFTGRIQKHSCGNASQLCAEMHCQVMVTQKLKAAFQAGGTHICNCVLPQCRRSRWPPWARWTEGNSCLCNSTTWPRSWHPAHRGCHHL